MLRRICMRWISEEQRLQDILKKLPKDQFIPKIDRNRIIKNPSDGSLASQFKEMKQKFGEDFVTPNEKYDLHLPRVDTVEGGKAGYERLWERDDFARPRSFVRRFLGFSIITFLAITFVNERYKAMNKRSLKMYKDSLEYEKAKSIYQNKIIEKRKEHIKKIKKEIYEKHGVDFEPKNLDPKF